MFLTEYLISVDIDLIVQELHQYLKNNIPVCQISLSRVSVTLQLLGG